VDAITNSTLWCCPSGPADFISFGFFNFFSAISGVLSMYAKGSAACWVKMGMLYVFPLVKTLAK